MILNFGTCLYKSDNGTGSKFFNKIVNTSLYELDLVNNTNIEHVPVKYEPVWKYVDSDGVLRNSNYILSNGGEITVLDYVSLPLGVFRSKRFSVSNIEDTPQSTYLVKIWNVIDFDVVVSENVSFNYVGESVFDYGVFSIGSATSMRVDCGVRFVSKEHRDYWLRCIGMFRKVMIYNVSFGFVEGYIDVSTISSTSEDTAEFSVIAKII
jgi:hypothetical protein